MMRKMILALGILAVLGMGGWRYRVFAEEKHRIAEEARIQAEEHFPLVDAYKTPPVSYNEADSRPLYGRLISTTGRNSVFLTPSAQTLDLNAQLDQSYTQEFRRLYGYMQTDESVAEFSKRRPDLTAPIEKAYSDSTNSLIKLGSFAEKIDTRVRVLDISGHYAKFKILEGPHKGSVMFASPAQLMVK